MLRILFRHGHSSNVLFQSISFAKPYASVRFALEIAWPRDHSLHHLRGGKGIRTLDPLLARQVLSQLSYTPINPAATCSPMSSPT